MSDLSIELIMKELRLLHAEKVVERARIIRTISELSKANKLDKVEILRPELAAIERAIEALQLSILMWS